VSRTQSVVALEVADNDGTAAMRFHTQSLQNGGAVQAAYQVLSAEWSKPACPGDQKRIRVKAQ